MKERNGTIDFAKGLAIIVVVLGHVCQQVGGGTRALHEIIQTFQMPLFMFLSGYCALYSLPIKKFDSYLLNKARCLLVPYLSWVMIMWGMSLPNIAAVFSGKVWLVLFKTIVTSGFWFLRILFYIFLLVALHELLLRKVQKKHRGIKIACSVGIILLSGILSVLPGCGGLYKHYIFFLCGMLLHKLEDQNIVTKRMETLTLCGSFIAYGICLLIMFQYKGSLLGQLADYAAAFLGILAVYYACKFVFPYVKRKFMISIGCMTQGIYSFHWCVLFAMGYGNYVNAFSFIQNDIVKALIITAIWLVLSVLFVTVIKKTKILAFALLGVRH